MSLISDAFAQTSSQPADPSAIYNLLPLVLIFAVFYIFLIRPQQKKLKEHENVINSIKRGDEVVTGGGILGKVSKIEEGSNIVLIEIADGVVVRINKATIIDVINSGVKEQNNPVEKAEKKSKKNKGN